MIGKLPIAGKSLSIGGPNNLLPDLPEKILQSSKYKKSIPLIIGTTQNDGSYPATGMFFSISNFIQSIPNITFDDRIFSLNFTVAYDYLALTNQLNDKDFMMNDFINALYKFLGRK